MEDAGSSPVRGANNAVLAQMEEQLPCKHQVVGSIPTCGTKIASLAQLNRALGFEPRGCGFESYEERQ